MPISKIDDIESLFYTMLDLLGFDLIEDLSVESSEESKHAETPVFNYKQPSCSEMKMSHIKDKNQATYLPVKLSLCDDLMLKKQVPTSLILYFKYLRTLGHNLEPDYQYLI